MRTVIVRKACRNTLLDAAFGGEDEYADTSNTDTSYADASYTDTSTNTGSNEMETLNEAYTGTENYGAAANEMETLNTAYTGTENYGAAANEMETLNTAYTGTENYGAAANEMETLNAAYTGTENYGAAANEMETLNTAYTGTENYGAAANEMETLNTAYTGTENYGAAANEMETLNAAYTGTGGWGVPQEGVVPPNEMETQNAAFTQPGTDPVTAPGVIPQEGVVPPNEMETLNDAFTQPGTDPVTAPGVIPQEGVVPPNEMETLNEAFPGDQTRDQPAADTPPDPLADVNLAQHNLSEQQLATLRDHLAGRPVDDGALNNIPNNVWADLEAQRQGGSLELAADRTPSPALPGSPYHPDQVQQRVLPPYDPVHERDGYKANPNKTPEPPDARRVYEQGRDQGRLFRANTGTYFGVGDRGEIYRYQTSQSGPDGQMRSHFNGVVPVNHPDIPNELRRQIGNSAFQRAFRYGLGRGPARGAE
ncbi:MAG: hypothetical protein IPG50_10560 [Myxococcales bacterium]|nr:hypothetical protein [Myxococcales bacterium]